MNEDSWENLDVSEWRDPELIREYLNDAPVRFRERELKAEMINSSEMMGSGEKKRENNSWNAPDGWKEFS